MRKKSTPVMEITLCGARGVVVGDGRQRSVPLRTDRAYDVTLATLDLAGSMNEVAAYTRPSRWQRILYALRG